MGRAEGLKQQGQEASVPLSLVQASSLMSCFC